MISQTAESFFVIDIRDPIASALFKPEHCVKRLLLISDDFKSDIESTNELHGMINKLDVPKSASIETELNPLFFPTENGIDPHIEYLDDAIILPRFDAMSDFVESRLTIKPTGDDDAQPMVVGKVVLHKFNLPGLPELRELDEERHTAWN